MGKYPVPLRKAEPKRPDSGYRKGVTGLGIVPYTSLPLMLVTLQCPSTCMWVPQTGFKGCGGSRGRICQGRSRGRVCQDEAPHDFGKPVLRRFFSRNTIPSQQDSRIVEFFVSLVTRRRENVAQPLFIVRQYLIQLLDCC